MWRHGWGRGSGQPLAECLCVPGTVLVSCTFSSLVVARCVESCHDLNLPDEEPEAQGCWEASPEPQSWAVSEQGAYSSSRVVSVPWAARVTEVRMGSGGRCQLRV